MDAQVNYTISDGTNLSKTADDQIALLNAEGFNQEDNTNLKAAIADLNTKEVAQGQAVNLTDKKNNSKAKIVSKTTANIQRLKEAARGAYIEDKKKLKQFKSDEAIPKGSATLSTLCEYLAPIAEENISILSKNGFNQQDLDYLKGAAELIRNAASDSKSALKLQKAATMIRNDASDVVLKLTKKIRKFVKARFSDRPEVMVLFEPLSKGKSGSIGEEEKPAETPASPDATNK